MYIFFENPVSPWGKVFAICGSTWRDGVFDLFPVPLRMNVFVCDVTTARSCGVGNSAWQCTVYSTVWYEYVGGKY